MWRAPGFWRAGAGGAAASLLAPAAAVYGAAVGLRRRLATPFAAPMPVICIGNPGLGGAGKTPTAIAVAARLRGLGASPHFLSRGYGGRLAGPITVDEANHTAGDVGDEPLLLARHAPAHIARDRAAGARQAAAAGAGVIVMDDGFQNPTIAKDCAVLVIDAATGIGNGRVFPAGPLRERWPSQLARADAVIVMGDGEAGREIAAACRNAGVDVFTARMVPPSGAPSFEGRDVVAFCGIAAPEKFEASLVAAGANVVTVLGFADHHDYSRADVERILAAARGHDGALVVTTEKDMVRLGTGNDPDGQLRKLASVLPIEVVFDDPAGIDRLLADALARKAPAG